MTYTKHYNGSNLQNRIQARKDAVNYLPTEVYCLLMDNLMDLYCDGDRISVMRLICSSVGIKGLPASVLIADTINAARKYRDAR